MSQATWCYLVAATDETEHFITTYEPEENSGYVTLFKFLVTTAGGAYADHENLIRALEDLR